MYQQNDTDMTTTMITTNNALTITRMTVIAKRTGSELMAGAKGMMIENLKKQMRGGIAHFVYMKRNGELREAWGTLNSSLVQKNINGRGISRERYATSAYYDVEVAGWRSFRWENLVIIL